MSVGFTTAAALVHALMEARDKRRLLNLLRQISCLGLLIIDELGFVPLSPTGAELLFEVFSQRYERGSIHDDHQPALRRVDRGVRPGTTDRSVAGPSGPPRPHPGDERRKLTASSAAGRTPRLKLQTIARKNRAHRQRLSLPAPVTSPP